MQDSRKIEWDEIVKLGIDNSANINEEPDETTSFLFQAFAPSVLEPDKLGNESKNKLSEAKARKMGRDVDVYGKLHLELNLGDSGGEDQRERGERQIEQYVAGQLVSRARFSLAQAFEKVIESDELRYNEWIAIFDALSSEMRQKLSKALKKSGKERGVVVVREGIFFSDEDEEEFKQEMIKQHGEHGVRFTF